VLFEVLLVVPAQREVAQSMDAQAQVRHGTQG